MTSFGKKIGLIGEPENSAPTAPCIQKYIQSDLYCELESRRPDLLHFVREKHSWNQIVNIIITAYSQITRERDPGLIPKMEKNHEKALCLNSHSGL